jgi:endonuclease YncB( thermonuclease family)
MRILGTMLLVLTLAEPVSAEAISPSEIHVIDGDTIRAHGHPYRLTDFDAPETGRRSQCDSERALGHRATARLQALIERGVLDLKRIQCSCPAGTEGTRFCNFGRRCGKLTVNGRDVGAILIAEGLARPFRCSATRCPPISGWCN